MGLVPRWPVRGAGPGARQVTRLEHHEGGCTGPLDEAEKRGEEDSLFGSSDEEEPATKAPADVGARLVQAPPKTPAVEEEEEEGGGDEGKDEGYWSI